MTFDTLQVALEPGHKSLETSQNSLDKTLAGRRFQSVILSLGVIVLNGKPGFGNTPLHITSRCIFEVETAKI